jgi:cytochrome c-type biogenesis protein CcmE
MKPKYIIGGIIVLVFIVWGASAFIQTTVTYVSFEKAMKSDKPVQVAGHIDFEDVNFDDANNRLVFSIYEMDPEDPAKPERMKIIYAGVVPGNFDQATSIVAVGKPGEGGFIADKLLVKCPSKYQGAQGKSN